MPLARDDFRKDCDRIGGVERGFPPFASTAGKRAERCFGGTPTALLANDKLRISTIDSACRDSSIRSC
jgi:hypothetical protein